MKTFTVFGAKVKACTSGCAESFREDRRHGLIYPPYSIDGGPLVGVAEASMKANFCVYCGASAGEEVE